MGLWEDLDRESRKPGPTMTITKAQYSALLGAAKCGCQRPWLHVPIIADTPPAPDPHYRIPHRCPEDCPSYLNEL